MLYSKAKELTPIQVKDHFTFKRDDLFIPFDNEWINGGKLRQAVIHIHKNLEFIKNNNKKLVSLGTVHSPQSYIVSSIGKYYNIPVHIITGCRIIENSVFLTKARELQANIILVKNPRNNYIKYYERINYPDDFIINYGLATKDENVLKESISEQCQNLPDVNTLCITVGSGNVAIGIINGINIYKKNVNEIILFGIAPNREKMIRSKIPSHLQQKVRYIDLFKIVQKFSYEKREFAEVDGIQLAGNYEAKVYNFMLKYMPKLINNNNLFWIIGYQ